MYVKKVGVAYDVTKKLPKGAKVASIRFLK